LVADQGASGAVHPLDDDPLTLIDAGDVSGRPFLPFVCFFCPWHRGLPQEFGDFVHTCPAFDLVQALELGGDAFEIGSAWISGLQVSLDRVEHAGHLSENEVGGGDSHQVRFGGVEVAHGALEACRPPRAMPPLARVRGIDGRLEVTFDRLLQRSGCLKISRGLSARARTKPIGACPAGKPSVQGSKFRGTSPRPFPPRHEHSFLDELRRRIAIAQGHGSQLPSRLKASKSHFAGRIDAVKSS